MYLKLKLIKLGKIDLLVQGTIYPDIVESGTKTSATIKSHHNVGGLPEDIQFRSYSKPLRELFKDEVRAVGEELGIPHDLRMASTIPRSWSCYPRSRRSN